MARCDDITTYLNQAHYAGNYDSLTEYNDVDSATAHANTIIDFVTEHRRALFEHRNSLTPIGKLPPEMLSRISRYCSPTPQLEHKRLWTCLAFSQVCRRWRFIVLEDPVIWTSPVCSRPKLTELMLTRARNLPLCIDANCDTDDRCYEGAGVAFRKHTNFEHLALTADGDQMEELIQLITFPMPNLKTLRLCSSESVLLQSKGLEGFVAQQLQYLHLENCLFPSTARCFSNLTTLEIRLRPWDDVATGFLQFVGILAGSPMLERLVLEHAVLIPRATPELPTDAKVLLTYLEHFQVEDVMKHMAYFFRYLSLPNARRLQLTNCESDEEEDAIALCQALNHWRLGEANLNDLGKLVCRIQDDDSLKLEIHCTRRFTDGERHAIIDLSFTLENDTASDTIDGFLHEFNFRGLKSFGIDLAQDCSPTLLRLILKFMAVVPTMASVDVHNDALIPLLEVFESASATSHAEIPFPFLQKLSLFSPILNHIREESEMTPLRRLGLVLKDLKRRGRPVREVCISMPQYVTNCRAVPRRSREDIEQFDAEITISRLGDFAWLPDVTVIGNFFDNA